MPGTEKDSFIVFGAPDIQEAEIAEVEAVLRSGWIGTGPRVARLETEFAAYKEVDEDRVAAVNSCTAALHLSMVAAGLGHGDEVLTTAMTFCATANAIIHSGATPVPVDIDPVTWNIDIDRLEASITPNTKAIVPVHFAGRPCDMEAIIALAERHGLIVIEDCAHAVESQWRGRAAGTFGNFGCFSFYVTKNMTTGEGGMVIGRSRSDMERIKVLALHGMSKDAWHRFGDQGYKHYRVVEAGFKYNMMDLQAALGIYQLGRIESGWRRRQSIWAKYQEALGSLPVGRPADPAPDTRHAFHLYTITISEDACGIDRDSFIGRMGDLGVGVGVHYQSLASHPYYQRTYGWHPTAFPNAAQFGANTVSLPLSPSLTDSDIARIVEATEQALAP